MMVIHNNNINNSFNSSSNNNSNTEGQMEVVHVGKEKERNAN
jgi:hypothetical protein